jgi:hypothetical protein
MLKGLKVMNTRWSNTMALEPYLAHSFGFGAFLSIASRLARSFGLVFIAESIVIPVVQSSIPRGTSMR